MKLIEARHIGSMEVFWIRDLEWSDILEYDNVPFIDPKTGVLVIAADGAYENAYVNIHTFNHDEMKYEIPWAVEVAGTQRQVDQFLDTYFPHWEEDKKMTSQVWDKNSLERVIADASSKPKPTEKRDFSWMGEQVNRILEASYHRPLTADEAYDIYVSFFEKTKQRSFGKVVAVDYDYIQGHEELSLFTNCYAMIYLWVVDATMKQAEKAIVEFAKNQNLPFTDFDIDTGVLKGVEDFRYGKLHCTLFYHGKCGEEITEARTLSRPTTHISRHQVFNLYKEHETPVGTRDIRKKNSPHIQVQQRSYNRSIIPYISFWFHDGLSEEESEELAKTYMRDHGLPWTYVDVASRFGKSITQVVFRYGEYEDLKEARTLAQTSVEDVLRQYNEIEEYIRTTNPEGYGYYDSEATGRITTVTPRIDTEYSSSPTAEFGILVHNCKSKKEAEDRMKAFAKQLEVPYNDIEYGAGTFDTDQKMGFIFQYRTSGKRIYEARQGTPITPLQVNKVHRQYCDLEDRVDDLDDPRIYAKILTDLMKGDQTSEDVIDKYLDNGKPSLNPDLTVEDGYLVASLSARWTIKTPEPLDKHTELKRLRDFALSLDVPYTEIRTDTEWQDFGSVQMQFSEAVLIFKSQTK